jgi:hypothetical protein
MNQLLCSKRALVPWCSRNFDLRMTRCEEWEQAGFSVFGPARPWLLLPGNWTTSKAGAVRVCLLLVTYTGSKARLLLR